MLEGAPSADNIIQMEPIIFHNTHGFICKGIHVTTISEKTGHGFERGCGQ